MQRLYSQTMSRYRRITQRSWQTLACVIVFLVSRPGWAQATEIEARQLIQAYVEAHNSHALDEVMALYHEDAVFHLNAGRPAVSGKSAIRGLELFDTVAGSTIYPQALVFTERDDEWTVDIGGAIEHSSIFAAIGVTIVMAEPINAAFVLADNRIKAVRQPELAQSCLRAILAGFQGVANWLVDTGKQESAELVRDGRIYLTPETIPGVVKAILAWREATGWAPPRADVSACAGFPAEPDSGR